MDKKRRIRKSHILLGIYCILLVWIILFKLSSSITELNEMMGMRSINLIPFYYDADVSFHFSEVMKNLIVFIPLGLYLKMIDVDSKKSIICGLLFSFVLEACQFIFKMGASDITDILTNTLGTVTGVVMYLLLLKVFKNHDKMNSVLEFLAFIATLGLVTLLLLLVLAS